jgi:DNA-binding transcriptional LysR family regulator
VKLQYLQTLAAVVDTGSFTSAAQEVNLSVSAVSLQMRQLEAYFRQSLFDRSGRHIQATPFAQKLVVTAQRAIDEIESMREDYAQIPSGLVRLGITESVETTLFPASYADLCKRAPQIEIRIQRGHTAGLLAAVKAGRLDVALIVRPNAQGGAQLIVTELWRQPFVLLTPKGMELFDIPGMFRTYPWIRLSRQLITGKIAARYVNQLVPQCKALIDLESIDSAAALVGQGTGIAILPRLRPELLKSHAVKEVSLGADTPFRHLMLVKRKNDADNRRVLLVEDAFFRAAKKLSGSDRAQL